MKTRITALLLALIITVVGMLALSACTPTTPECTEHVDEDNNLICDVCEAELEPEIQPDPDANKTKYTFTLTVKDYEGNPIEGLKVKFLYNNETTETEVVTTNANGQAIVEIATERKVVAQFVDLEGWGSPKKKALTFEALEYNLEVSLNPTVKIKLVDADGALIVGAKVAVCNDSGCSDTFTTDENGEVNVPIKPNGKFKLRIVSVPEGYAMPTLVEGGDTEELYDDYHAYFEESLREFTFEIPKA